MKLAIMQPYLFPYLGYFQLISAVDSFIVLDDVQYRKGGWINRNKICIHEQPYIFTFSLKKDSTFLNINQRYFSDSFQKEKDYFIQTLHHNYRRAPYYSQTMLILERIFYQNEKNLSLFITSSLKILCDYLSISTSFQLSSNIDKMVDVKGENRVIKIIKSVGASTYINAINGMELYSKNRFYKEGIKLKFIKMKEILYDQQSDMFIPNLSIIDVLMYNGRNKTEKFLLQYELI